MDFSEIYSAIYKQPSQTVSMHYTEWINLLLPLKFAEDYFLSNSQLLLRK